MLYSLLFTLYFLLIPVFDCACEALLLTFHFSRFYLSVWFSGHKLLFTSYFLLLISYCFRVVDRAFESLLKHSFHVLRPGHQRLQAAQQSFVNTFETAIAHYQDMVSRPGLAYHLIHDSPDTLADAGRHTGLACHLLE